jgi:hypothetical protein
VTTPPTDAKIRRAPRLGARAIRRLGFAAVVGLAAVAVDPTPARAQIAAAIGKPLPSPDLPAGTITVRVIAGSPADPVVGTDVTVDVNGTPRVARTDSAGRATFKDLPVGATVQAKVTDEDGKEHASDSFEVPADSGARLMITTKPFEPGGGGAPFAGGGGGMPEPRQMSGQPRPEQSDSPGTYTVRLTYDDFKDKTPPAGVAVALVGYHADDTVDLQVATSDKDGRATFGGLDRTGAVSYFAMTQLPRNGAVDRLISTPAVLDSRSGVRLILSAEKRDSTEPPVDDIARIEKQDHAPEAGKARITLEGIPESNAEVHLIAMHATGSGHGERRELAHALPVRSTPDPADIQAQSQFTPKPDVPAHAVHIQVHGGPNVNEAIPGASVRLVPANTKDGAPVDGVEVKTPTDGYLELTNPANEPLVAIITINGKQMTSQPFDLTKSGGDLDVEAHWDAAGKLSADFDVSGVRPDEVVFAETTMRNQHYRSIPFQPAAGRGTRVTLYIYPRIMFTFSLTSHIDDEFLAVGGRFEVSNNSWAPYIGGTDGLIIPLPAHFKGAGIAEQDQGDVAVAQGEGFRLGRPIPPGGKQFHGAFSLPVENGRCDWAMDLPLGSFQSGLEIQQTPGMSVQLPPSVKGQTMTVPQGTYFVLPSISIMPKQAMVMSITGLPSPPAWRRWAPRIVGILAILVMLGGLGFALQRTTATRAADVVRAAKRAKLLDELVELERNHKDAKRRAQIATELEALWDDAST